MWNNVARLSGGSLNKYMQIRNLRRWMSDESGQAMSEYGLLLALVAVALIAAVVAFRDTLITKFTNIKNSINSAV